MSCCTVLILLSRLFSKANPRKLWLSQWALSTWYLWPVISRTVLIPVSDFILCLNHLVWLKHTTYILTVGTFHSLQLQTFDVYKFKWEVFFFCWGTVDLKFVSFKYTEKVIQIYQLSSVQFISVAQSCLTLCDPMNCSTPGLPVHHQLPEFTQTHVHWVSDAIQPSHPLSSPSPPAPNPSQHQSLFQWVNSSHEVAKVLEFQL